jgi:acyl dehydratase
MEQPISFDSVDVGDELPPLRLQLSNEMVRVYAEASEMPAGRFLSDEAARAEGLPGQILPGNMSLAFFSRLVSSWDSTASIRRLSATFRRLVHPNAALLLSAVVTEKHASEDGRFVECDLVLEDGDGERLVTGTATVQFAGTP